MEAMPCVWGYQESMDDLKNRLLCATFELESARAEANLEARNNEENIRQLLQLLKLAYQERDEARDQLQRLINKLMIPSNPTTEIFQNVPTLNITNFSSNPIRGNSSNTDSDGLSELCNPQSYVSSPVDSLFDPVSSPDFSSNIGIVTNVPFIQEYNNVPYVEPVTVRNDPGWALIEELTRGKPLPSKGKLLQAVIESGPLLQTLLVAGTLPQWINPPPQQPVDIPMLLIKDCEPKASKGTPVSMKQSFFPFQSFSTSFYNDIGNASPQTYSTSNTGKRQKSQS